MRVIFEGGDSRSNIGLLPRGVAYENGVRFHATMGSFPSIEGKLLEWRYHGSKLVALIVRMVAGSEENGDEFHGLVVFRVDTTKLNQSCAIGKTTSNEEARAIADDPSRPCFQSAYRGRLVIIAVLPAHGTPGFSKNLAYRLETLLGSERVW